jgi:hypothetical protein
MNTFDFKPKEEIHVIPFFDDVTAAQGWEGHTTSKSLDKLQSEIATNLTLIGCIFSGCRNGTYGNRQGFQIHFAMKSEAGQMIPSRLDIACLPINPKRRTNHTRHSRGGPARDWRIEATQKMALYMTAKAIKGMYFLNVLSPTFIPFMSLMLDQKGQTLGQLWQEQGALAQLMPPADEQFVEGEII